MLSDVVSPAAARRTAGRERRRQHQARAPTTFTSMPGSISCVRPDLLHLYFYRRVVRGRCGCARFIDQTLTFLAHLGVHAVLRRRGAVLLSVRRGGGCAYVWLWRAPGAATWSSWARYLRPWNLVSHQCSLRGDTALPPLLPPSRRVDELLRQPAVSGGSSSRISSGWAQWRCGGRRSGSRGCCQARKQAGSLGSW